MAVNTTQVTGRRQLHFNNLDEVFADVEQLARGPVRAMGNWSPGQVLEHLAKTMDGSIEGQTFKAPWWIRPVARLLKKRILTHPMAPGWQLKGGAADALIPPAVTWEQGLERFRQAIARQKTEERRGPNAVLGPMTREEWNQLHCRHAELHLSFLKPAG